MQKPPAAAEGSEKLAAAPVAAEGELAFPWSSEDRRTYPGTEERRENWKKHYASLQKKYAESCGLEDSHRLVGSTDEMATLSEANALQQEAGEEEFQTADEMVDAPPAENPQASFKGSQDGVGAEGKEVEERLETKPPKTEEKQETEPEQQQEKLETKPPETEDKEETKRLETRPARTAWQL